MSNYAMAIQSKPLSEALHLLHARWYKGVVTASILFGLILALPWMTMERQDLRSWILASAIAVGAGALFKGTTLGLTRWARGQEYKNWVQWCQGSMASTGAGRVHQQRRTREAIEQALLEDVQALARAGGVYDGTWLRPGPAVPSAHDLMAGEVLALQQAMARSRLECKTWQWGRPGARQARARQAEAVGIRWHQRYG